MPRLLILTLTILAISASAQMTRPVSRYKGRPTFKISTAVLEKTAIRKVMPVAPVGVRASGVVRVRVWIDADGKLVEAKAISGHPILRDFALKAAFKWEWKEVECINGVAPIGVGVLNFDFPPQQ